MQRTLLTAILCMTFLWGSCNNAESDTDTITEEYPDMLETESIPYATEFANCQRNSLLPVKTVAQGTILWAKRHASTDITPVPNPYGIRVGGECIGIVDALELVMYDLQGEFKFSVPIGPGAPVLFGRAAYAFARPSYLLEYADYGGETLMELKSFGNMQEFTEVLLFSPTWDDVVAAFQFTGGPRHLPPRYDVFRLPMEDVLPAWILGNEGTIDGAVLSQDGATVFVALDNDIRVLNSSDGAQVNRFSTSLASVETLSLAADGNLVMIGVRVIEEDDQTREQSVVQVMDRSGRLLWSYDLTAPHTIQPPACGGDGRVALVDGMKLLCLMSGEVRFEYELSYAEEPWLTVTADDHLICMDGRELTLLTPEGQEVFSVEITDEAEEFHLPAAVNGAGQIIVAGDKKLYCFN